MKRRQQHCRWAGWGIWGAAWVYVYGGGGVCVHTCSLCVWCIVACAAVIERACVRRACCVPMPVLQCGVLIAVPGGGVLHTRHTTYLPSRLPRPGHGFFLCLLI